MRFGLQSHMQSTVSTNISRAPSIHYTMCEGIENDIEKIVDPMGEAGSVSFPSEPEIADAVHQQAKGGGD